MSVDYIILPWSKLKEATKLNYTHIPIARHEATKLAKETGENVFVFFCQEVIIPEPARAVEQRDEADLPQHSGLDPFDEYQDCQKCEGARGIHNGIVQKCPICGDDEIDLWNNRNVP
jgi:hypothetical protein